MPYSKMRAEVQEQLRRLGYRMWAAFRARGVGIVESDTARDARLAVEAGRALQLKALFVRPGRGGRP